MKKAIGPTYTTYVSTNVVRSCLEFAVVRIKTAEQWTIIQQYVIGTLAVNEWAVTFGTARRGLGELRPCRFPSSLYQM